MKHIQMHTARYRRKTKQGQPMHITFSSQTKRQKRRRILKMASTRTEKKLPNQILCQKRTEKNGSDSKRAVKQRPVRGGVLEWATVTGAGATGAWTQARQCQLELEHRRTDASCGTRRHNPTVEASQCLPCDERAPSLLVNSSVRFHVRESRCFARTGLGHGVHIDNGVQSNTQHKPQLCRLRSADDRHSAFSSQHKHQVYTRPLLHHDERWCNLQEICIPLNRMT
jgi:hypothetical protein